MFCIFCTSPVVMDVGLRQCGSSRVDLALDKDLFRSGLGNGSLGEAKGVILEVLVVSVTRNREPVR